jgi:hypothetical protein
VVMPTLNYHPQRTRDGRWLQMGNLLPHLFMNFVRAIGLADELAALGVSGQPDLWPEDCREAFRDRLLMRLQDKTLDEWQAIFIADGGVASHPYQSTQQALDDPDAIANGHSIPMGDTGRQLGLLAKLTRTPGRGGAQAPALDCNAAVLAELAHAGKPTQALPLPTMPALARTSRVAADPALAAHAAHAATGRTGRTCRLAHRQGGALPAPRWPPHWSRLRPSSRALQRLAAGRSGRAGRVEPLEGDLPRRRAWAAR